MQDISGRDSPVSGAVEPHPLGRRTGIGERAGEFDMVSIRLSALAGRSRDMRGLAPRIRACGECPSPAILVGARTSTFPRLRGEVKMGRARFIEACPRLVKAGPCSPNRRQTEDFRTTP
jgi:hypothetical protein